jgi:hypothetical protein
MHGGFWDGSRRAILGSFTAFGLAFVMSYGVGSTYPAAFAAEPTTTETIVILRHGEKPEAGLGQLDCQGLNRSLALPAVMGKMFGRPDAIFAPDPSEMKSDQGHLYNYIRPLATVEPLAVSLGMPIDTSIGVSNIDALRAKLETPAYRSALAFIAWEHNEIPKLTRQLVSDSGGDPAVVSDWDRQDFDSIYVIKITRTGGNSTVIFDHRHESLNGQPKSCPTTMPR